MKIYRFPLLLTILILGSFFLSACTGTLVNSWPGLSATQNTIYLAYQGAVYAINPKDGTTACKFPEKADASKHFYAAPAVSDALIVAGSYGKVLYGLDPACGGNSVFPQKWAFNTEVNDPDHKAGNFAGSPLIVNDVVLAPATNNRLYALSAQDGSLLWKFETRNTLWTTPASDGKVVFLPALDHHLYALQLSDGSQVWKKDLGSALTGTPLLTEDGTLYVSTLEGNLFALKAADGSQVWMAQTGGRLWSAPVLKDDLLYVGNAANKVSAISVKDGSIAWQQDAGSQVIGGGIFVKDGVAFATEGGSLIAWSLDGKSKLWTKTIGGKLYTTPVTAGDTTVVALVEGDKLLQAVNPDGNLSWVFTQPK